MELSTYIIANCVYVYIYLCETRWFLVNGTEVASNYQKIRTARITIISNIRLYLHMIYTYTLHKYTLLFIFTVS
jgi:hypothetical protein